MLMLTKVVIFLGLLEMCLSKKCSSDFECPSIQKCLSGVCHEDYKPEPCVARSDCLRSMYGYGCVQGRCGCVSTNQDCPAGNFCTKKRCLLTGKYCNTNKECQGSNKGHRCTEGQCTCLSDKDCNLNHNCVEKVCVLNKEKMKEHMKSQREEIQRENMYRMHGNDVDEEGMDMEYEF